MIKMIARSLCGLGLCAAMVGANASAHGIVLGVGTHVAGNVPEQPAQLDLARRIGFDAVRDDFLWRYIEPTPGVYKMPFAFDRYIDAARQRGIEPLVILDYGNPFYDGGDKPLSQRAIEAYVRYASFVVKHFSGRVHYFEIWNEWDDSAGGFHGRSASDYARLFDAVYPVLKRLDPDAVFLASAGAGGHNSWYQHLAELGVAARADGVAVHPYVYPSEPFFGTARGSDEAERSVQNVINIEKMMSRLSGGKVIPLYVTEVGWPTNVGKYGMTEEGVRAEVPRALLMFSALPFVHGVWWYDLRDDCPSDTNKECRFGVAHRDLSLKPAGRAIQSIASIVKRNALTMNSMTNFAAGLVVLSDPTSSGNRIVAWHVGPAGGAYAVRCTPTLPVVSAAGGASASAFAVTAEPTVFSYQNGHCAQSALSGSGPP